MSHEDAPRQPVLRSVTRLRHRMSRLLSRIDWMMLFPAAAALAWVYGHDAVAMVLVIVLPVFLALNGATRSDTRNPDGAGQAIRSGRVVERATLTDLLDDVLKTCTGQNLNTALVLVQIDDLPVGEGDWGEDVGGRVMQLLATRVSGAVRGRDSVFRYAEDGLAIVLSPTQRTDLDVLMQVVDRVQAAIAEGLPVEGRTIHVQSNVGVCAQSAAPDAGGEALMTAADCALRIARRAGGGAARAFDPAMQDQVESDHRLAAQVADALRDGQIKPWFQPQIDAATGSLTGLEALARWHHPEFGVLSPDQFLPAISAAGLTADLSDMILDQTLSSMTDWDEDGLDIPCIGVNLSLDELSDPRLADRIAFQVDQHGLTPDRISIEILETVTLQDGAEAVVRNLHTLRRSGFRLELDDFGTGAASIAHIAQFGVHRIKVDRSFVHGLKESTEQQRLVAAILGFARQLDIETLAEGVETSDERALLAEMGCGQLQGFGIARPMPRDDVSRWIRNHGRAHQQPLERMTIRGTA